MIKQIRRIGTASRTIAGSFHVKKRAKDFFTYAGIGTAGTIACWNISKVVTQPRIDEFLAMCPKIEMYRPVQKIKISGKKTVQFNLNWTEYETKTKNFFENVLPLKSQKSKRFERQIEHVLKIINDDSNTPFVVDREKLAEKIVFVSNRYGANPIEIACIVKKESHFISGLNGNNGKGLMQVTSSPLADIFQKGRAIFYHEKLNELKIIYPNKEALAEAVKAKDEVNLSVGTMVYLLHLKSTNGDIFTALKRYNGSSLQKTYATTIFNDIQKYKKAFNIKELT